MWMIIEASRKLVRLHINTHKLMVGNKELGFHLLYFTNNCNIHHLNNHPGEGQCVKKLRIYVRTTIILYGGITFNSPFFSHAIIM